MTAIYTEIIYCFYLNLYKFNKFDISINNIVIYLINIKNGE